MTVQFYMFILSRGQERNMGTKNTISVAYRKHKFCFEAERKRHLSSLYTTYIGVISELQNYSSTQELFAIINMGSIIINFPVDKEFKMFPAWKN